MYFSFIICSCLLAAVHQVVEIEMLVRMLYFDVGCIIFMVIDESPELPIRPEIKINNEIAQNVSSFVSDYGVI